MKAYAYGTVLICALSLCVGQILFKVAANAMKTGAVILDRQVYLPFAGAIAIYGVATLAWVWALQYVPLSKAFPFVAIGYIVVPAAGWFLFGERISSTYMLGGAFILAGVFLTSQA